jgi:hypothetical protein
MRMNTRTLWLDLDGVLADFEKKAREVCGDDIYEDPDRSDEMWEMLHSVPHFYRDLESCPGAASLWYHANRTGLRVKILTAIPRRSSVPMAEADKRDWCERFLDSSVQVVIGPYSRDKWKHCKPGDILIDDRDDNIRDWVKKGGGVGILHLNVADTIRQLHELMKAGASDGK